jgi:phosphohistidine phosphatase
LKEKGKNEFRKEEFIIKFMIILVQHGKAFTEQEDPERKLTPEGISETEKIAKFLASAGVKVNEIVHSGKTRAKQTAEIFSQYLKSPLRAVDGLNPNDDPTIWLKRLEEIDNIMLVGHLPHLSKLTSLLIFGSQERETVKFRYSAPLCLVRQEKNWSIIWYITPEIIP